MNILVVGSGGREHALVWKLRQSPSVGTLYCAPGNAGIASVATCVPLKATDFQGLLRFVRDKAVDLTVVGPEQPLVMGIVDVFREHGLVVFGPSASASRLEGSKVFAKEFMKRHGIPTARFASFAAGSGRQAEAFIESSSVPLVVKADGLAAGKGVVICQTKAEARIAVQEMLEAKAFGAAGENVVIEEFLEGEEASVFALSDGEHCVTLPCAQDHKRILDGDRGKNTGGMGAYAPAPIMTRELTDRVEKEIIRPTLGGMKEEGAPYRGCLYAGLMITKDGPKVLEYNCRFGDPETQVVVPLIDGDFAMLLKAAASGSLADYTPAFHKASAVCVVMASRGYPDEYETGKAIRGLDSVNVENGEIVFHAGTNRDGNTIITAGGRVLGVTAVGYKHELEATIDAAYRLVHRIAFDGAYYRSDIGKKALKHVKPGKHS
ncbi:MAG: phosphoribosylamine--glycine ligase [Ignavibacteriales bacterium]|nr:phosphoribosylamine--glycine ligase [Ignavibacteriales bacterium]